MNRLKKSSLLAILFFQLSAYSQNEYFANNPKWGISEPCQFSPFEPEWGKKTTYYVDGDTVLNEEVFVKIFQVGFTYYGTGTSSYTETPYSNPLPLAFLRSEEMKMFKWNEELNIKELLYDFDITVGEPFDLSPNISNTLVVESISYITLGGIERKVITVLSAQPSWEYIYIEGVGHWRGIWHPNGPQLDCQSYLTCFSINGDSYVVNTDETPWIVPSTEICQFVVGIDEIETHETMVYPNPATLELSIQSSTPISSITISDLTGRNVYTTQPNATSTQVHIESLSTGYYFLSATTANGTVQTLKFLKD